MDITAIFLGAFLIYVLLIRPAEISAKKNEEILTLLRTLLREMGYSDFEIACVAENGGMREEALRAFEQGVGYGIDDPKKLEEVVERDREALKKTASHYTRI